MNTYTFGKCLLATGAVVAVVLIGACASNGRSASAVVMKDSPTRSATPKLQDPALRFPPLERASEPSETHAYAEQLAATDPVSWLQRTGATRLHGIEHAHNYRAIALAGRPLGAPRDLAPYSFLWPAPPDSQLQPVASDLGGLGVVLTVEGPGTLAISYPRVGPDGKIVMRTRRHEVSIAVPGQLHPDAASATMKEPITEALLTSDPESRWSWLRFQAPVVAAHPDVRYLIAQREVQALLEVGTTVLQAFPTSIDQALGATGQVMINLEPVDPAEADLVIEFDGQQAFRTRLTYPSGVVEDTVVWFFKITPEATSCRYSSFDLYQQHVGRPMTPFAAFRLVPSERAALPGIQ